MARMTGAKAIVKSLQRYGVDTLFGIPGVQLDHLFVALYDDRESIRVVATGTSRGAPTWRTATPGPRGVSRVHRGAGAGIPQLVGGARHRVCGQRAGPVHHGTGALRADRTEMREPITRSGTSWRSYGS